MRIILASFDPADNLATTSVGIVAHAKDLYGGGIEIPEVLATDDTGTVLAAVGRQ